MNCQEVTELMQRYLDKDLSETEYDVLLQHMQRCPECTEMYERLKQLSGELENLPKVNPPCSIVDSIMPRLLEIDRMQGQHSAGHDTYGQQKATSKRLERSHQAGDGHDPGTSASNRHTGRTFWQRHISLKWMSGVVAAGIVLGVYLFQQQPSLPEQAEHARFMSGSSSNTSQAPMSMRMDTVQKNGQLSDTAAEADTDNFIAEPGEEERSSIKATHSNGEEQSLASGPNDAPDAPMLRPPTAPPVEQPDSSIQQPVTEEDAHFFGISSIPERLEVQDQYGVSESYPSEETTDPSYRESVLDAEEKGKKEDAVDVTITESASELVSPDLEFAAIVRDKQVVVLNRADGSEVYVSANRWSEGEAILLKQWSERRLSYEVSTPEGTQVMIIDLQSGTEEVCPME